MWTAITIISIVLILGAISVFFLEKDKKEYTKLQFRFKNIVLPIAIALIATVVVIFAFTTFPGKVPYKFATDGTVTKTMAVYSYIVLMLSVQFGIVLVNIVLNYALIKLSEWITKNSSFTFKANIMQFIVTNVVVIPQLIMAFILINSAYYCSNGAIIMPPMQFSLIVILASMLALIVLFVMGYKQTKNAMFKEQ